MATFFRSLGFICKLLSSHNSLQKSKKNAYEISEIFYSILKCQYINSEFQNSKVKYRKAGGQTQLLYLNFVWLMRILKIANGRTDDTCDNSA